MNYTENKDRKVYNIDFDHTLTADPVGTYPPDPAPDLHMINAIKRLYMSGHIVIIWTARQWENASFMVSWLIRYNVPFHGVFMGKGGSDCYIDDKVMTIEEFLK